MFEIRKTKKKAVRPKPRFWFFIVFLIYLFIKGNGKCLSTLYFREFEFIELKLSECLVIQIWRSHVHYFTKVHTWKSLCTISLKSIGKSRITLNIWHIWPRIASNFHVKLLTASYFHFYSKLHHKITSK